ncbi:glutamine--fructose-6-phosphate transaminase (isomerizing) [Pelagibaculum spongiae]|uniref:Glutamine--fructose-6-phosphate aminotransferase [isomerizing] n=1 Tax=Pelagibaculum spongiae TaxID=2080658 RepID=A0A2V1H185_9GAMM|nr:glutamine--fructose-6-phosphate transaminase (isomerizing) [Pelagibaculum spongiae]PVZ68340.1 glutamine--fructose-6-phosphate transaminase (isomerizing) [Pelagibaculum spongiae]
MCGIVGAVAQRDVAEILLEGLRRLEYRGYDSAGIAIINPEQQINRLRRLGKVQELGNALKETPLTGGTGISHTRWATHGEPSERNAHPHQSADIVVVHNGIIENHELLRNQLRDQGYNFSSDTDTEVMAHLVAELRKQTSSLLEAVQQAVKQLHGAYGAAFIDRTQPDSLVVARSGSPLVIGYGIGENFVGSDPLALLPVTRKFAYLEEGDVAEISRHEVKIFDQNAHPVERKIHESDLSYDASDKGEYRHYMLKEIHEQPRAVTDTMEGRVTQDGVAAEAFGPEAAKLLPGIKSVQIVACGTSYNSGMVARNWIERYAGIPCRVEIASEFRYRHTLVPEDCLFITISQSGETADTLAALRKAKEQGYAASLAICNVAGSSLVRESDLTFMTRAGAEIGVASTKAFTTQLTGLLMLTAVLARNNPQAEDALQKRFADGLHQLPALLKQCLALDSEILKLSQAFADKHHALFLGRGSQHAIAMEGALKLKEISYIHAEAYAAGELKHGPLALIDENMPVVVVAPNNDLLEKLKSNMEEVRARGGQLFVFADEAAGIKPEQGIQVLNVPHMDHLLAPIAYTLPLQLLSYHVAVLKGTDVDQPRNLAKSVTVE